MCLFPCLCFSSCQLAGGKVSLSPAASVPCPELFFFGFSGASFVKVSLVEGGWGFLCLWKYSERMFFHYLVFVETKCF